MTRRHHFHHTAPHHYAAHAPFNVAALKAKNAQRWANMHMKANRIAEFDEVAKRLCAEDAKARFTAVTTRLTADGHQPVPWWFIAVAAQREYDGPPHWDKQLGQGDPLDRKSVNDPAGRGPFLAHPGDVTPGNDAWTRGALDALIDCGPYAAKWTDWSIGGVLTLWEEYNGLGYAEMGVPSAYVWSGTDQYVSGKYIRDFVYRANVVDVQDGCAPILSRMMALDPSIKFADTLEAALDDLTNKPPPSIIKDA
jgi:lysozyme family protein